MPAVEGDTAYAGLPGMFSPVGRRGPAGLAKGPSADVRFVVLNVSQLYDGMEMEQMRACVKDYSKFNLDTKEQGKNSPSTPRFETQPFCAFPPIPFPDPEPTPFREQFKTLGGKRMVALSARSSREGLVEKEK